MVAQESKMGPRVLSRSDVVMDKAAAWAPGKEPIKLDDHTSLLHVIVQKNDKC